MPADRPLRNLTRDRLLGIYQGVTRRSAGQKIQSTKRIADR